MPGFQFFENAGEFATAFEGKAAGTGREDHLSAGAHYLAGTLHNTDFRLFKNGGLPLLERRYGPLRQEIVLCAAKKATGSHYPITLRLHLGHSGVRSIRERYWRPALLAPENIASGNAGALRGGYLLWDLAPGTEALRHLAHYVHDWILPWFELMEDPIAARDQLYSIGIPLLEGSAALEWVLAEFGQYEAANYLDSVLLADPLLKERVLRRMELALVNGTRMKQGDNEVEHLGVITEAYELRRRARGVGYYGL